MPHSQLNYLPLTLPFFSVLAFLLAALFIYVQLQAWRFAYSRLGLSPAAAMLLLLGSLLGAAINIPVYRLPEREVVSNQIVSFFGVDYVVPAVVDWPGTVIAVNVGGAVIPAVLSLVMLVRQRIWLEAALTTTVVAVACHLLARPVPGVGIMIPSLVPVIVTTIAALVLARKATAAVAYIAGSMGTLIGADLLNLGNLQGLGAPVASIGGAGTFDGIFLTGIMSVLLASIWTDRCSDFGA